MKKPLHKRVEDLMSTALVTVRETDRASDAMREMGICAIRHLPVVDGSGRLTGLVSSTDLAAALAKQEDPTLDRVMTRRVVTVRRDTPAERAVALMIDQKFSSVPVVGEGGQVVGIVTATDFLVVAYQALTGAPIVRQVDEV